MKTISQKPHSNLGWRNAPYPSRVRMQISLENEASSPAHQDRATKSRNQQLQHVKHFRDQRLKAQQYIIPRRSHGQVTKVDVACIYIRKYSDNYVNAYNCVEFAYVKHNSSRYDRTIRILLVILRRSNTAHTRIGKITRIRRKYST